MAINSITCPVCGAKIDFNEGDVVDRCVACKTEFQRPGAVKVAAKPDATVVLVEPINLSGVANG